MTEDHKNHDRGGHQKRSWPCGNHSEKILFPLGCGHCFHPVLIMRAMKRSSPIKQDIWRTPIPCESGFYPLLTADTTGPTGIAGSSSCASVRLSYPLPPGRRMYGLTSPFLLSAARKRASGVRDAQLFAQFILGRLMPDVLSCLCLIISHRVDMATTTPELPMTIFELQLAEPIIYHQAALSFQISDKRR